MTTVSSRTALWFCLELGDFGFELLDLLFELLHLGQHGNHQSVVIDSLGLIPSIDNDVGKVATVTYYYITYYYIDLIRPRYPFFLAFPSTSSYRPAITSSCLRELSFSCARKGRVR